MAALLAAQRDSTGLAFLPLNTPTNNTEAAASGYSPAQNKTPPPTPEEIAQLPPQKDALELLSDALGLPAQSLPADGIDNAHLSEQRTAMHMMNTLWRATFGHYLMELWNPPGEEKDLLLKTPAQYALRSYAVSWLRPAGPLPLLRVGKQPYGVLPVAGKAFVPDPAGGVLARLGINLAAVEQNVSKVLSVLRPMWELARNDVPLLTDGDVDRAKDILQTSPWSQTAAYRNVDNICLSPAVIDISGVQIPTKQQLVQTLLATLGVNQDDAWSIPIWSCMSFPPDPPYSPGSLAGVPWVLADDKQPTIEAAPETEFSDAQNYLKQIADALTLPQAQSDAKLSAFQSGPALLEALAACSVQLERHDAVQSFAFLQRGGKQGGIGRPAQAGERGKPRAKRSRVHDQQSQTARGGGDPQPDRPGEPGPACVEQPRGAAHFHQCRQGEQHERRVSRRHREPGAAAAQCRRRAGKPELSRHLSGG